MEERNKKAEAIALAQALQLKEKEEAKQREEAKVEKVDLKAKRKIQEIEPEDD